MKKYKFSEWPISAHTLSLYAQHLAYTFHSAHAIRNYLNGIRTLHILVGTTPPSLKDIELRLTMRGLMKTLARPVRQAHPLTPEILLDILALLDVSKIKDLMFWATLLVGFFGMLRKSNLMPDTVESFDPLKQLTRGHIAFKEKIALLRVTWSKTIQFRQRTLEIPLFPIENSPLCPVTALKSVMSRTGGKENSPLFGTGKHVAFTYKPVPKEI